MSSTEDAQRLERTLERLADTGVDITPDVYARFFARSPEARSLFDDDSDTSHGRMLNELLTTLLDQAEGKSFVNHLVEAYVTDHCGYGVEQPGLYEQFLSALQETVSALLGDSWPRNEKDAFERQCRVLYEQLRKAGGGPAN